MLTLKCVEITSQRQADNGTVSYFDPQTETCYNLYENGYVRRSFGRKRLRNGKLSDETIYQLNPTRMVDHIFNRYDGVSVTYKCKERIMLNTHEERMNCAARAVINYRNTTRKYQESIQDQQEILNRLKKRTENMNFNKQSTLTAVEDEINQYREGNLTLDMAINGIKELINQI